MKKTEDQERKKPEAARVVFPAIPHWRRPRFKARDAWLAPKSHQRACRPTSFSVTTPTSVEHRHCGNADPQIVCKYAQGLLFQIMPAPHSLPPTAASFARPILSSNFRLLRPPRPFFPLPPPSPAASFLPTPPAFFFPTACSARLQFCLSPPSILPPPFAACSDSSSSTRLRQEAKNTLDDTLHEGLVEGDVGGRRECFWHHLEYR